MILVECNPDEALVNFLGIKKKEIIHGNGKSGICKKLKSKENIKGLVDEDPLSPQPKYIEGLKLIEKNHNIKLLYDNDKHNFLIVLCPRLEEWILKAAKEAGVDISDYGLPDNGNDLHKVINFRIGSFKKLLVELKGKSQKLETLERFIKYDRK